MHELLGPHALAFETDVLETRVIEMTKIFSGRKATLYAAGMAVSLFAMTGAAHAQSAGAYNGTYKKNTWALTKEDKGAAKPAATLTAEQQAAADAAASKKAYLTANALVNRSNATVTAYNAYTTAIAGEKSAITAAASAATALTTAEKNKTAADALASSLLAKKAVADAAVVTATTAQTAAVAARAALSSSATQAEIDAADLAVYKAGLNVGLANRDAAPLATQYATAQTAAANALTAYTNAITAKANADGAVLNAQASKTTTASTFNTALAADTNFAAAVAAINSVAGTNFAVSYDGMLAIEAYDDAPPAERYASNGFTRATNTLTSAAASTNQYISLASGALTGSTAALDAGANFETEVLGALVDHEGRIVSNTTAISALDVRTTANTTAITAETAARIAADTTEANARIAEDKRIVGLVAAETEARMAQNAETRDRIASSTATAIALGGAALLPDMGFTLSGNVAFYEGAQAVALNAAAKVGPNAYITAAAGGGLNKKGSVGGRVGFVIGF